MGLFSAEFLTRDLFWRIMFVTSLYNHLTNTSSTHFTAYRSSFIIRTVWWKCKA